MKKALLLMSLLLSACMAFAQDNIERTSDNPTGYVKATRPYVYGTIDGVLYVFNGREPYILVRFPAADTRESFEIPSTVVRISRGAFCGCINLKELVIPQSVVYIGENAFDDSSITSFVVSGNDIVAIADIQRDQPRKEDTVWYDLSGRQLDQPAKGVNIATGNGSPHKVIIK